MKRLIVAAVMVGGAVATYRRVVLPWWKTWGIDDRDVGRALPGDDQVPTPWAVDTRSLEIDALPSDVWPLLVQMGYGRAGWYSYDAIDMAGASSRRIVPEWQSLDVGDVVPTHPGGGFEVRFVEPGEALVLYSDTALVVGQAEAARVAGATGPAPNVQATGAFLGATQPTEFSASWAFVLEPVAGGRTRLIERFRVRFGDTDKPWTVMTLPAVGFGVFLMMRKQMLGIRDRAQASRSPGAIAEGEVDRVAPTASQELVAAPTA
jgi:hypothetical protein